MSRIARRDERARNLINLFGLAVTIGLVFSLRHGRPRRPSDLWALNLELMCVLTLTLALPHELGHFLAARMVGLKVRRFTLGVGAELWRRQIERVTVVLRWLPFGGEVLWEQPAGRECRAQTFIAVLGGPIAHVVLLACLLPWLPSARVLAADSISRNLTLPELYAAANFLVLAWNVLPIYIPRNGRFLPSDGLMLLRLLRRSSALQECSTNRV